MWSFEYLTHAIEYHGTHWYVSRCKPYQLNQVSLHFPLFFCHSINTGLFYLGEWIGDGVIKAIQRCAEYYSYAVSIKKSASLTNSCEKHVYCHFAILLLLSPQILVHEGIHVLGPAVHKDGVLFNNTQTILFLPLSNNHCPFGDFSINEQVVCYF